jgi:hypothetical protein
MRFSSMKFSSRRSTAIVATVFVVYVPGAEAACGDFLAKLMRKPPHLQYSSCRHHVGGDGDSWLAQYRVRGVYAAEVEDFLGKNFGLVHLTKSCCQWDGPAADYTQAQAHYEITMASDEDSSSVVTSSRSDWSKLAYFHVTVQYYAPE